MFCQQCGAPLAQGVAFCTECGKPVEAPVPEFTDERSAAPVQTVPVQPVPIVHEDARGNLGPLPDATAGGQQAPAPKKGKKVAVALVASVVVIAVFAVAAVGLVQSGLIPLAGAPEAEEPLASASEGESGDSSEGVPSVSPVENEGEEVGSSQDGESREIAASIENHDSESSTTGTQEGGKKNGSAVEKKDVDTREEDKPAVSNEELAAKYSQSSKTLHESAANSARSAAEEELFYVLPDSDSRYYGESELDDLSDWELYIARNEIYARLGRTFQNEDLTIYFESQPWYEGRYAPGEFDAYVELNDYERKNTTTIRSLEEKRGSSYVL